LASSPAIARRARSDAQKHLRRKTILDAADALFSEVGFEAFSMAELGRRAGVVKGTLYLYFGTREEVLLALHCDKLGAWRRRIEAALADMSDDESFAAAFYSAAYAQPGLLSLMSRLDSVIEHNVSLDALIQAKRLMAAELDSLAQRMAERLDLSYEQSYKALMALAPLLLGVSQIDSGPRLDELEVPEDVRAFTRAFSSRELFIDNARRILTGIRREAR
jgi:AcrR family transcriptional regulator